MIRPTSRDTILNVIGRMTGETMAAIDDAYAAADVALMSMLLMAAAQEAESGIENRAADIREMDALFAQAGTLPDLPETLRERLADPAVTAPITSLRASALDRLHDARTAVLIELHEHMETRGDATGERMDVAIWQHLRRRAERDALGDTMI